MNKKFKCLVHSLVKENAANVSKIRRNLEEREEEYQANSIWLQCLFAVTPSQRLQGPRNKN